MFLIKLNNLKGIKGLQFIVPEQNDVYLITGPNGCGKTSLLVALSRMRNPNAFAEGYRVTGYDKYENSKITYDYNGTSISYTKSDQRWSVTPKKEAKNIQAAFPYNVVSFLTTNGKRLYETPEQLLKVRRTERAAEPTIISAMNKILDTTKFNDLKYVQVKSMKGRQVNLHRENKLYILKNSRGDKYSELSFSLGERLLLNALIFIESVTNNSLLLIDEIELALHPIAQVRFYQYLQEVVKSKKLTVIISTHSSSLVKVVKHRFYLEPQSDGTVEVLCDCAPSYILKDISAEDDNKPDVLFLVEDVMARRYLNYIICKYDPYEQSKLHYKTIYVGSYDSVVKMVSQLGSIQPFDKKRIQALPDKDTEDTLASLKAKPDPTDSDKKTIELFTKESRHISYLDITPELEVWNELLVDSTFFMNKLEKIYGRQTFNINNLISSVDAEEKGKNTGNLRAHAKYCLKNLYDKVKSHIDAISGEDVFYDILFDSYVDHRLTDGSYVNYYKKIFEMVRNRK